MHLIEVIAVQSVFIGSLVEGYVVNYLLGVFSLVLGSQILYALSAIGRGGGALTFTTLKKDSKYPSTLRKELREIVQKFTLMPEGGSIKP